MASTFMLAFWEERRRDYPAMMLHHVVSVFLIGASYVQGCAPEVAACTLATQL